MPRWPNTAVAARKPRSWTRPVVCDRPEAMCAPINSGGISWAVQRVMCWRSNGSMQSETHTRSVRSSTPRSTRASARRARLDLQAWVGGADLVEQAVEGERLVMHPGPVTVDLRAGLDEVAVVVPLDEVDVVFVDERQDVLLDVLVRLGDADVEHLLVARLDRPLAPCRHDPLRVGAGEVGVGVDHLRLEPQTELHAQLAHVVDERVEAVRPHLRRDDPVAEPGSIVAPRAEPAVVEHEPLDPELGGPVGEVDELRFVVVEVHRLPDVERDRPVGRDRAGTGSQVFVEAPRDLVEADAERAVDPRAGVALAAVEPNLAGQQQLAAAEHALTGEDPLGGVDVVAAERGVDGVHVAPCEAEPRRSGVQARTRCPRRCGPCGSPAGGCRH